MEGLIGVIAPGAHADILLTKENPLESIAGLAQPEQGIPTVIKAGSVIKHPSVSSRI
jgi:imidazolonepropionase-like amidohydrolase